MQAIKGGEALDTLPLPRRGAAVPGEGLDLRTPTHRLVAVADDEESVRRAIRRHEARGWVYVEGEREHHLYFGQRMLTFRRMTPTDDRRGRRWCHQPTRRPTSSPARACT